MGINNLTETTDLSQLFKSVADNKVPENINKSLIDTEIINDNGRYKIIFNGKVFNYKGKEEFESSKYNEDGSILISLDSEALNECKFILLNSNGKLFKYNDNVEFYFILRFSGGETYFLVDKDSVPILINKDNVTREISI